MVCSRLLFAASIDEADLDRPSNKPLVSMGCVFAHKIVTSSKKNRRG